MIPSLLQIPSAVSDSKLHSVLPNNGKGDFQFDRSTGATRINRDGLIEEVGYFSSELVQNGNFSELGSDVVLNGNFDNGSTSWTLIGDVSIGNGVCTFFDTGSNANSRLIQVGITANKTYKLVFDVTRYVEGGIQVIFGGAAAKSLDISAGVGTYTMYLTAGSSTQWEIKRWGLYPNFDFDIDNVSVKQVDPNDRWALGTGWGYGNGVASRTSQSGSSLLGASGTTLTVGKTYKCTMTVSNYSNGAVRFATDNFGFTLYSANGTYTEILTSTGTAFNIKGNADFTGSVTNISVVEVQGDRPRLSYDITNGVVEDKPHLLLEPSATNLVTFSEDFSQISLLQSTITTNNIKSPNGLIKGNLWLANATSAAKELQEQYSVTSGTTYTESWFVKYKSLQFIQMVTTSATFGAFYGNFDLVNGTKGNSNYTNCSIEAYPDGWYRIQATQVATSTGTGRLGGLRMIASATASRGGSITTDGTEGVYVWGHQVEQQSYATSYIPTAGTTITRSAETCNNSKPSVNSTEGVFYCEIQALAADSTNKYIALSDGSLSNRVNIFFDASNVLRGFVTGISSMSTSATITDYNKIALKYKSGDISLFLNGSEVGTRTNSLSLSGLNTVAFDNGGGSIFYGKVKGLAVYNEALSESQLMQLTGVTASSIYNNFVTRTASFTVEALNEVKKVIDNL